MTFLQTSLQVLLLIFIVVMLFNIIIFVHELGHFLAGKWRGLQIDRFQIWFGKPIWKKEYKGVQYGLGWIPAGGFVALPQMAPMEAIEGGDKDRKPLPAITPMDKIIVAIAGPLFSLLLALVAAVVVWGVGKPNDFMPTQVIGEVVKDSPAEKAGLKEGDKIIQINGDTVNGFAGSLDSIVEKIVLSEGNEITFLVERPGVDKPLAITSRFDIPKTKWFQRGGLRQVGIGPEKDRVEVGSVYKGSPAAKAGIEAGDTIVSMNGEKFRDADKAVEFVKSVGEQPIKFEILRSGEVVRLAVTPQIPISPKDKGPMLGVAFSGVPFINVETVNPNPFEQVGDSLRMMWTTITKLVTPKSSIGIGHLSGPVGIGSVMFDFLKMENGWQRILGFMVLFNVNLAVLNMLPFPVLDGGHITLALLEKIFGRPVNMKMLEIIQTACALGLITLMLYVTSKDIGDKFGREGGGGSGEKIIFAE